MTDQLVDIVLAAFDGKAAALAGEAAGIDPNSAAQAFRRQIPEIARRARETAERDQESYEELLDLIEDGNAAALLDNPSALATPETRSDGEAILEALYGSAAAAQAGAGKAGPLMPLIAAMTIAAIARRGQASMATAAAMPQPASGGLVGSILSALLAGLVNGLIQALRRRTRSSSGRRRTAYGQRGGTRARAPRRRSRQPSLDEIFGEILKTRR